MKLKSFLGALFAGGLLVMSANSHAATFDVYGCHLPDGRPAGIEGWVSTPTKDASTFNDCRGLGYFGATISMGSAKDGINGRWTFSAPDGTSIANYTLHRAMHSVSGTGWVKGAALYHDAIALDDEHTDDTCLAWSGTCSTLGNPNDPLGPGTEFSRSGQDAARLFAVVHCFGGCPQTGSTGVIHIYASRVGLSDPNPPTILEDPHGPLFRRDRLSGVRDVSFAASDRGGGIYRVGLAVDGSVYASQPVQPGRGSCAPPITTPVPCPLSASGTYAFDTRSVPDGTHRLRLAVTDIAGNTTLSRPRTVTIRNVAIANGFGADRHARLTAGFGVHHAHYRVTHSGGRPTIVGLLRRADGRPIVAAVVKVVARTKRSGSKAKVVGRVRTNGAGRFRYRLHRGPSRRLRVAYRAYDLDARAATSRGLELDVHAGVTLTIHPRRVVNGHRIVFHGRLRGGPGRAGALVTLQETRPKPLTFKTIHADRHGRFHASYRFRYTTQRSLFGFRALVQKQAGYPYLGGRSRALNVLVTP